MAYCDDETKIFHLLAITKDKIAKAISILYFLLEKGDDVLIVMTEGIKQEVLNLENLRGRLSNNTQSSEKRKVPKREKYAVIM